MKQILFSVLIIGLGMMALSCEEQEKLGFEQSDKGFNLRVAPDKNTFDISAGDPEINFVIYSDTKTIDRVQILVEFLKFGSESATSIKLLKEIPGNQLGTTPSINVPIKLSEFAGAVGITLDELGGGDQFTVHNKVLMADGRVYPDTLQFGDDQFVNVENSFFTSAASTSYTTTLSFAVLCPFIPVDAEGTYTVTRDDAEVLWEPDHEPVVVAGPGPSQVTIKNLFGHPQNYDVVVDVNPETAVATVSKQVAWDSDNFGFGLGPASIEGQGLFFSCTGFLTLDLVHSVEAFAFDGTYKLEMTKKP
jgi:hypothetical protein